MQGDVFVCHLMTQGETCPKAVSVCVLRLCSLADKGQAFFLLCAAH